MKGLKKITQELMEVLETNANFVRDTIEENECTPCSVDWDMDRDECCCSKKLNFDFSKCCVWIYNHNAVCSQCNKR